MHLQPLPHPTGPLPEGRHRFLKEPGVKSGRKEKEEKENEKKRRASPKAPTVRFG